MSTVHLKVGKYLACGEHPSAINSANINAVTCKQCISFAPPGVKKEVERELVYSDPDVPQEPTETFLG